VEHFVNEDNASYAARHLTDMRNTVLAAFAILASGCSAPGLAPEGADEPPPSSRRVPEPADGEDWSTKLPPRSEPDPSTLESIVAVSDWIIWGPSPTGDVDEGREQLATADDPREVAP
jgi:hypothetical protein